MKPLLHCICFSALTLWGQNERELMRKAVQDFVDHQARLGDFLYVVKGHNKEFQGDGKLKSESRWVRERKKYGEFRITAPVERDGKPLSEADRASVQKDIDRIVGELKAQTPEQREKAKRERLERARKEDPWIQEMPDAMNLKRIGEEQWNGRVTSIYEATPNPSYRPKDMQARVFEKMRGKIWLDKLETQLVRADVEVFDTVNIGFGMLGRIEKGTRFSVSRVKASPDTWLTAEQTMKIAARIMLVKPMYRESSTQWMFKPSE